MSSPAAEPGYFCQHTHNSLRDFQHARGLDVDGICGEYTWSGLVEASRRIGDRLLVLTAPNLRGDDVASLQSNLGRLGFDCGKVDGIFGPMTAHALVDFQSNCGLVADGSCGSVTLEAIDRVGRQSGAGPGVAIVRERDLLQQRHPSLRGVRIVVGQFGGLSALSRGLSRDLRIGGAHVISVDEPDQREQAEAANAFRADLYVGFLATSDGANHVSYYSVPTFESPGGRDLAHRLALGLAELPGFQPADCSSLVRGMRIQVLRETRMPAVVISLTEIRQCLDRASELTAVVRDALEAWTGGTLAT